LPVIVADNPALFTGAVVAQPQAALPVASPSVILMVLVHILAPPTKPEPCHIPDTGILISGAFAKF
jgi:hypothetical protein